MVEKRVYSSWAFQDNAAEKCDMNKLIYKELKEKYRINTNGLVFNTQLRKFEDVNPDDYDVIIKGAGSSYACQHYSIIKNAPNLSNAELALICDGGNLCFGYRGGGKTITIHTD